MNPLNDESRRQLAEFVPSALETAIESYEKIVKDKPEEEEKIKAYYERCKAALAHIELVLKVAKSIEEYLQKSVIEEIVTAEEILKTAHVEIIERKGSDNA